MQRNLQNEKRASSFYYIEFLNILNISNSLLCRFVDCDWILGKYMFSFTYTNSYNSPIGSVFDLKYIYSSRQFQRTLRVVASPVIQI